VVTSFIADSIIEARKSYREVMRVLEEQKRIEEGTTDSGPEVKEDVIKEAIEKIEETTEMQEEKASGKIRPKIHVNARKKE
jgi:uncharacterized protein YutE (UPF0331/DUF86 family)